jgi:hypothetical protein
LSFDFVAHRFTFLSFAKIAASKSRRPGIKVTEFYHPT